MERKWNKPNWRAGCLERGKSGSEGGGWKSAYEGNSLTAYPTLVSLDAIHPGESYPGNAESHRDAKGWLRKQFGYREVRDQARYTRLLDIEATCKRSRSFQRLCHAFQDLIAACAMGQPIVTPRSGEVALRVGNSEEA